VRAHNWHALGWIIWAVATVGFFAIWEMIGLANRTDDKQPLTYYVRKMVGTPNNPMWWVLAAVLIWMIYHFNFVHGS
jgi:hypothetical protein